MKLEKDKAENLTLNANASIKMLAFSLYEIDPYGGKIDQHLLW